MTNERTAVTWWARGTTPHKQLMEELALYDWVALTSNKPSADDRGEPYCVLLSIGRSSTGRLICQGMILGNFVPMDGWTNTSAEITARSLREIPLAEMLSDAVRSREMPDEWGAAIRELLDNAPEAGIIPRVRPGPRGHPDSYFRQVAALYKKALLVAPKSHMSWLTEQLHWSEATTRRHVRIARNKGFLSEPSATTTDDGGRSAK